MSAGEAVIRVLSDRKGFDWWWEDLDDLIRSHILAALDEIVVLKSVSE